MNDLLTRASLLITAALMLVPSTVASAQGMNGCPMMTGKGGGAMGGMAGKMRRPMSGMGRMGGGSMMPGDANRGRDMGVFHDLLANHDKIRRTVKPLPGGVETLTESDDPAVAAKIKEHVPAMYARLKKGQGIHLMDPLYVALFQNGKKIDPQITLTAKGVRVVETSRDPYVVKLIKEHAASVNDLVKKGMPGMATMHPVPAK